jgi:hypothetical protein
MPRLLLGLLGAFVLIVPLVPADALAQKGPASRPAASPEAPASEPATKTAPPPTHKGDPFASLVVVTPRNKLGPLRSVRVRDKREAKDRSREGEVTISIGSQPRGALVTYGQKSLGTTPVTLTAQRGSTPYDIVIRARGYMTLHARIERKTTRSYVFKLTPAKL